MIYANIDAQNLSVKGRRGRGALVERLTATPVMHASWVRTRWFSVDLSDKYPCVVWLGNHVNGGLVEFGTSVSTVIWRRATRCALIHQRERRWILLHVRITKVYTRTLNLVINSYFLFIYLIQLPLIFRDVGPMVDLVWCWAITLI